MKNSKRNRTKKALKRASQHTKGAPPVSKYALKKRARGDQNVTEN